jgi:hypothetical protein
MREVDFLWARIGVVATRERREAEYDGIKDSLRWKRLAAGIEQN